MKTSQEIIDAIDSLNKRLLSAGHPEECAVTYSTNGDQHVVEFMGQTLWDSDNDDRVFYDAENDWEPYEKAFSRAATATLMTCAATLDCLCSGKTKEASA